MTSPNDPIFFIHHANMNQSRVWWQSAHRDASCDYYGYPTTDAVPTAAGEGGGGGGGAGRCPLDLGVNLHEAISLAWGFTYADIGVADDPADRSVQLTHGDAHPRSHLLHLRHAHRRVPRCTR